MRKEDLDYLKKLGATQQDIDFIDKNNIDFVAVYSTKKDCIESEIFYRGEEYFDFGLDTIVLPSGKILALRTRG